MLIKEIYTFTRTLSDRVVIVLRRPRGRGADEDHREEEERKKKSSSGHFFSRCTFCVEKCEDIFGERKRDFSRAMDRR